MKYDTSTGNELIANLACTGLQLTIVGSVATRGQSDHDLDLVVGSRGSATQLQELHERMGELGLKLYEHGPLESPTGTWFDRYDGKDGALVEIYWPNGYPEE